MLKLDLSKLMPKARKQAPIARDEVKLLNEREILAVAGGKGSGSGRSGGTGDPNKG